MTGVRYCDTDIELNEEIEEFGKNPDFTFLDNFDSIQDIYFELNEHGFSDEQIEKMTINRYGHCVEILEYASSYTVFVGMR